MDRDETGAYKEIHIRYCPTCQRPKDEVIDALGDIRKKIVQVILLFSLFISLIVPDIAGSVGITDPVTNSLGMEFVYIASGAFTMGSPTDELGSIVHFREYRILRIH